MKNILIIQACLLLVLLVSFSCDSSTTITETEETEDPIEEEEKEWQLVWADEFEGEELDESKWSFQYGTGAAEGLNGWGNNELQYYTDRPENITIDDGILNITARNEQFEGMNYTSGRIRTMGKRDWTYGRVEVRAKLPRGQGIWPAIWMLPTDEIFGGWPKSGEIDIMEMVGHEPEKVHGTVHYGPDWPENQFTGTSYSLDDGTFADDFHIFSIEWKMDSIKWFVDGNEFFSVTPSRLQPHQYPFNARFHLVMNLAVGGNWPGIPDETTEFPQSLIVDYVRIYQFK
jgi:beta-glucanase (GH16 family)